MSNSNTNENQEPTTMIPLANLANLSHKNNTSSHSLSLIPGPFVVLQGSPGDGMANTIDSMPVLPLDYPWNDDNTNDVADGDVNAVVGGNRDNAASNSASDNRNAGGESSGGNNGNDDIAINVSNSNGNGNNINGTSSRRNSSAAIQERIPSMVLEDLDEDEDDAVVEAIATASTTTDTMMAPETPRQHNLQSIISQSPIASPNAATATNHISNSTVANEVPSTGGGLHLPLGTSSPIMRRMRANSAGSCGVGGVGVGSVGGGGYMDTGSFSPPPFSSDSRRLTTSCAGVTLLGGPLPIFNAGGDDGSKNNQIYANDDNVAMKGAVRGGYDNNKERRKNETSGNVATEVESVSALMPLLKRRPLVDNHAEINGEGGGRDAMPPSISPRISGGITQNGGRDAGAGAILPPFPGISNVDLPDHGINRLMEERSDGKEAECMDIDQPIHENSNEGNPTPLNGRNQSTAQLEVTTQGQHESPKQHHYKSPMEREVHLKWHQECREHESSTFDETIQNVRVLLQQRRRQKECEQQRREQLAARQNAHRASGGRILDSQFPAALRRRGSSSFMGVANASADAATTSGTAESQDQTNQCEEYNNEIDKIELIEKHRSWYQCDGRLIVMKSLPHMSLHDGVVAVPIGTTLTVDGSHHHHHHRPITLSPGSIIMAEEVFALDSRSLRVIHHVPSSTALDFDDKFDSSSAPLIQMLRISSPHEGYIVSMMHGYPYLAPGLPSTYINAQNWYWRVACQPDGAFIRKGLELITNHVDTLPFGSIFRVEKKVVNSMGLNRLKVVGYLEKNRRSVQGSSDCGNGNIGKRDALRRRKDSKRGTTNSSKGFQCGEEDPIGITEVSGWISEFLNPLSGQRGPVAAPIPFPVPALYRVAHPDGVIIRSGVELSTSQIGFAPSGTVLSIIGRAYSDHPREQCIERLRLAGGGGWISTCLNRPPPGNDSLVEMIGVDGSFDPDDSGQFHLEAQRKVMQELQAPRENESNTEGRSVDLRDIQYRRQQSLLGADLSEINEDDWTDRQSSISDSEDTMPIETPNNTAAPVPTLFRSGAAAGMPGLMRGTAVGSGHASSHSQGHHHPDPHQNRCLICLSDERTATLVHGETGHIACCLCCSRILKARGDNCPVCRLPIDLVIQHFWA